MGVISTVCRQVLVIVLTVLSMLSAPFAVLLIPVYSLRFLVAYLAKVFRKDLGKMLTPRANLFTVEYSEMFKKRSRCTIYVTHVLDGDCNIDEVREFILNKVVNLKQPELKNPELQQKITSWLGYLFWQWDTDFKIENHIKHYEGPGKVDLVSDDDIVLINKELAVKPFSPHQSPWEFWLWNNARLKRDPEQRRKSIIILRVHHSLADGYSVLKLLLEDIAGLKILSSVCQPKAKKPSSFLQIIWNSIVFVVKAPYEIISMSIHAWDFNDWHIPESKITGKINAAMTEPIPLSFLKEIKNMYGTTMNAVIQTAFTGGLRNFMMEQHEKIPKFLHCMTPLPMPGHPTKLRNHMTAFIAPLPVGIEDARDRMRFVDVSLKKLNSSTVPVATFYLLPLVGGLPAWVVKILATNLITTCLMTNFPAPFSRIHLLGCDVDDIMFGGGLLVGNIGIGLNSLSYNGGIRLAVGIDEAVVSNPELVKILIQKVEEELHILRGHEII